MPPAAIGARAQPVRARARGDDRAHLHRARGLLARDAVRGERVVLCAQVRHHGPVESLQARLVVAREVGVRRAAAGEGGTGEQTQEEEDVLVHARNTITTSSRSARGFSPLSREGIVAEQRAEPGEPSAHGVGHRLHGGPAMRPRPRRRRGGSPRFATGASRPAPGPRSATSRSAASRSGAAQGPSTASVANASKRPIRARKFPRARVEDDRVGEEQAPLAGHGRSCAA